LTPLVLSGVTQPGGYGTGADGHLIRHNGHDVPRVPREVAAEQAA
jgi:hypothetical protein